MHKRHIRTLPWHQKKLTAALAFIFMALFFVTGTYALYATTGGLYGSTSNNAEKSVVLHDDFAGGPSKYVYVENTSETTEVFVRIKLQEYMDLTSWIDRDPQGSEWTTHIPSGAAHDCGLANGATALFHEHFAWSMGGAAWYVPEAAGMSGKVNNPGVNSLTPDATQTPDAPVILMSEYQAKGAVERRFFVGWVYDADGWTYWSQPLLPETATAPLLSAVAFEPTVAGRDFFYAINVLMEAVDINDLPMWTVPSGDNDGLGLPSAADPESQTQLATNDGAAMLEFIAKAELVSFEVATAPAKTAYVPGEYFDPTGLVLKAVFSDGTEQLIDSGYDYAPTSELSPGTTHIDVSYFGLTTTVPITVNRVIDHIEVSTDPTKTKYIPGEFFDPAGLEIKVVYTDNSSEIISAGFAYSPTGALADGTKQITVSYEGHTTTVPVIVNYLVDLHLKAPNTKVTIDGIGWEVVYARTMNGKNYVLLITAKNSDLYYYHNYLTTFMTDYYTNTIKKSQTLKDYVVVPAFTNTSYYPDGINHVISRSSAPTSILAKDTSQTADIAFALDLLEVYYTTYKDNGWDPKSIAGSWLYNYVSNFDIKYCANSTGTWQILHSTDYAQYHPAIWVMVP